MPIQINGETYYRTQESCREAGISRATLYRWLKAGILEKSYKDRRGWRIFTEDDLRRIKAEATRVEVEYSPGGNQK
jgi:DNA-binding transcriptional MerR regulator